MGGGVSTNHKSSNRIELSWLGQDLLNFSDLTWSHPSTHSPIHPPTKSCTQPWVGNSPQISNLHRFQIFKQNWNILISSSAIEFWPIPGVPPGGGRWVDGGGVRYGCIRGVPCTHTSTHMHVKHDKHDKHWCLHVGSHLQFLYMRLHACVCMCMHVVTPPMLPDTPQPPAPSP